MGTFDALYGMISGGVVPTGIDFMMGFAAAAICATADSVALPGRRNTLTTDTPASDWLSMWSTLLTVVVTARSNCVVIRPSISRGSRPVYVHTAATTGMFISG